MTVTKRLDLVSVLALLAKFHGTTMQEENPGRGNSQSVRRRYPKTGG